MYDVQSKCDTRVACGDVEHVLAADRMVSSHPSAALVGACGILGPDTPEPTWTSLGLDGSGPAFVPNDRALQGD